MADIVIWFEDIKAFYPEEVVLAARGTAFNRARRELEGSFTARCTAGYALALQTQKEMNEVPWSELRKVEAAFRRLDVDDSGTITVTDLMSWLPEGTSIF